MRAESPVHSENKDIWSLQSEKLNIQLKIQNTSHLTVANNAITFVHAVTVYSESSYGRVDEEKVSLPPCHKNIGYGGRELSPHRHARQLEIIHPIKHKKIMFKQKI